MWGRSSDRQHDLTSAGFLPSRTIRRSPCPSRTRFSQSPQPGGRAASLYVRVDQRRERRCGPDSRGRYGCSQRRPVRYPPVPEPGRRPCDSRAFLDKRTTGSTVPTSITRIIRWTTATNSKIT